MIQPSAPKSTEMTLLTSLYFAFHCALSHFKCYRLSVLILQNVKMGKWVHFLTSQAIVNVHWLRWRFHFQLINTHPPLDKQPGEKDVLTLAWEAEDFKHKAISLCPALPLETLLLYAVTSNKQTHTLQRNMHMPMFLTKWTKEFKISQVRKNKQGVNICKLHLSMHIFRCILIDLSQCLKLRSL